MSNVIYANFKPLTAEEILAIGGKIYGMSEDRKSIFWSLPELASESGAAEMLRHIREKTA